jgi:hypothetical protein
MTGQKRRIDLDDCDVLGYGSGSCMGTPDPCQLHTVHTESTYVCLMRLKIKDNVVIISSQNLFLIVTKL